ncbi:3-hydroxyacyl-CoA dehydrogenase NAD-binding domain-containing protein [Stella sp.]|uniref:3-hydroxyacyl-CoA dehydrogenase NAD-binding domain-containing protein n=1 Tax=Stella sp. TaxID=2912054 RepID=UPI0035B1D69B
MSSLVRVEIRDGVAVIAVDNPPVNALSVGVPDGIMAALAAGAADPAVGAFVLLGAGRTFIAGADIREFGKPRPAGAKTIFDLIAALEASPKPVVAAIHGTALGGGLEVALACHWRVGVRGSQYGLPEVKLGILPGAGGTQRLPRLIGVEPAAKLIVSGDFVPAEKALALGIVDALVEGDLAEAGAAFARQVVAEGRPLRLVRNMDDKLAVPDGFFADLRRSIAKSGRGQVAPWRCIDCVEAAATLPVDQGLKRERELFEECLASPQSKALRHFFFAEREVAKIPDVPKETPVRAVAKAAVIGAGTMGGGIAMTFANAGIPVTLVETGQEALDRGIGTMRANYGRTVASGRLSQAAMDKAMGLVSGTLELAAVADADIVIEAVFEDMAVKKDLFRRLDAIVRPGAILATNTSTLDVDEIAAVTKRPEAVIGTHFFSPANVMKLLEVVRGAKTDKPTVASTMALAKPLKKVAVLVGVCDGFVGNRMLAGYMQQALFLLEEGCLPQDVDKALYDFGFAMGPFAMMDLAGNDVEWRIRKHREKTKPPPTDLRRSALPDLLCEAGRFGQKTAAGWYRYEPGDRTPHPDAAVEAMIVENSARIGIRRRAIAADEIVRRCLLPLVNEGARILDEGLALRPGDIDVIWVYGYGFPAYKGGPMFHADQIGLPEVLAQLLRLESEQGRFWTPSPLIVRLAEAGRGFASLKAG